MYETTRGSCQTMTGCLGMMLDAGPIITEAGGDTDGAPADSGPTGDGN